MPHGMDGSDERVDVAELNQVARMHELIAFDLLTAIELPEGNTP
jgi:hypothetical protein